MRSAQQLLEADSQNAVAWYLCPQNLAQVVSLGKRQTFETKEYCFTIFKFFLIIKIFINFWRYYQLTFSQITVNKQCRRAVAVWDRSSVENIYSLKKLSQTPTFENRSSFVYTLWKKRHRVRYLKKTFISTHLFCYGLISLHVSDCPVGFCNVYCIFLRQAKWCRSFYITLVTHTNAAVLSYVSDMPWNGALIWCTIHLMIWSSSAWKQSAYWSPTNQWIKDVIHKIPSSARSQLRFSENEACVGQKSLPRPFDYSRLFASPKHFKICAPWIWQVATDLIGDSPALSRVCTEGFWTLYRHWGGMTCWSSWCLVFRQKPWKQNECSLDLWTHIHWNVDIWLILLLVGMAYR